MRAMGFWTTLCAGVTCVALASSRAAAETIVTKTATGTVTFSSAPVVAVGETYTLTYEYDPASADTFPADLDLGIYLTTGLAFTVSFSGGHVWDPGGFRILVCNKTDCFPPFGVGDYYGVFGQEGGPGLAGGVVLIGPESLFEGDALLDPVPISQWTVDSLLQIEFPEGTVQASVDTLTTAPPVEVPMVRGWRLLALSGLLGLRLVMSAGPPRRRFVRPGRCGRSAA